MAGKRKRRSAAPWTQTTVTVRTAKITELSSTRTKRRRYSSFNNSSKPSPENPAGVNERLPEKELNRSLRASSEVSMPNLTEHDDSLEEECFLPIRAIDEHRMDYCSTSDSDSDLLSDYEDDDLENREFARVSTAINRGSICSIPPQLTSSACLGVGDRREVWSIMCRKDKAIRPLHPNILDGTQLTSDTRAILVDWIMEVCENERQHRETFHLAIDYVDRFLAADKTVSVDVFQCIGTTALMMASKYEEIYPPKLRQFIEYTDDACSEHEVRETELLMLDKLQWSLSSLTSVHWLNMYIQLIGSKDLQQERDRHIEDQPCTIAKYLREDYMNMARVLDIALLDVDCMQFSYRELAAAVLFLCYEPQSLVQQVTGFSYEQLLHVIEWLDPCYKASLHIRGAGDPLPCISEVRSEEWHNIQTHLGPNSIDNYFRNVRADRIRAQKSRSKYRMARRPGPLRPRHP